MNESLAPTSSNPVWMTWAGRVLTALPLPLMAMGIIAKLRNDPQVAEGFKTWPAGSAMAIGITELVCCILYLVPQTAVLGAVLLTGYLGGATCVHVQKGESILFPVLFGVVFWLGLFFRDGRVRSLLPWRKV